MSSVAYQTAIRPMQVQDLGEVMVNERRCYSYPWNEGVFRDCLNSGNDCWLFVLDNQVIGHSVLSIGAGESHLLNVCINPDHQGAGFGRMLVEFMLKQAAKGGAEVVFLEVRPSNVPACQLYDTLGFSEVGVRTGYYPAVSGREDALVLSRRLLP